METIQTTQKTPLAKVNNDIFIYVKDGTYLKFTHVFQFNESEGCYLGHLTIWDNRAPFYIIFNKEYLKKLHIKGYNKCLFLPNSFKQEFDKNNKMFLRYVNEGGDCYLDYHPIKCVDDLRKLVELKSKGRMIYTGFPHRNGSKRLQTLGEAIEIIRCK